MLELAKVIWGIATDYDVGRGLSANVDQTILEMKFGLPDTVV